MPPVARQDLRPAPCPHLPNTAGSLPPQLAFSAHFFPFPVTQLLPVESSSRILDLKGAQLIWAGPIK